jgi:hypothetical protein
MKGVTAIYLGKIVDKKYFRTFVYNSNGEHKLVESWDEFESSMQSGIWFATPEDVNVGRKNNLKVKNKKISKSTTIVEKIEDDMDVVDELMSDGSVFEVTDDFLKNENS